MGFTAILVNNEQEAETFLSFPVKLYKNDKNWIRPLDQDIKSVFDKKTNKFFTTGSCERWNFYNDKNEIVGRVAAFVTSKYKQEQPTGGIGFYESINNQKLANFIFDHCKSWLIEKGMEAMDGPINFGERERWWGLLIEGFHEPLYCMNYNFPYYKELFENYGFQIYFNQECFGMNINYSFQDKFYARHKEHLNNPNLKVLNVSKNHLPKFAKDFTYIYNKAWASHGGGKTMDERMAVKMFATMKPVMDENISYFLYHKDEPIACWINLPDLNQYFKHSKGKFGLLQKLQFLYNKRFNQSHKILGLVFGIIPEWQGKGVDAYIILEGSRKIVDQTKYTDYEMQWIGDFNPKMGNVAKSLGAKLTRKLATYRYLFDQQKPFKRHPILK